MADFHLFPRFPTELRHQIWHHVAHQSQDVKLSITNKMSNYLIIRSSSTIPSLLHTTQESRQIGRGFYIDIFKGCWFSCHVYVNPAIDILCLTVFRSSRVLRLAKDRVVGKYGGRRMLVAVATVRGVEGVSYVVTKPGALPGSCGTGFKLDYDVDEVKDVLRRMEWEEFGGLRLGTLRGAFLRLMSDGGAWIDSSGPLIFMDM